MRSIRQALRRIVKRLERYEEEYLKEKLRGRYDTFSDGAQAALVKALHILEDELN